jgi:hypothetical protein
MVQAAADRVFLPTKSLLEQVGDTFNHVFTQTLLATHPEISIIK